VSPVGAMCLQPAWPCACRDSGVQPAKSHSIARAPDRSGSVQGHPPWPLGLRRSLGVRRSPRRCGRRSGPPARSRSDATELMTSNVVRTFRTRLPDRPEWAAAHTPVGGAGVGADDRSSYPPAMGASLRPVDGRKVAQDRSHRSGAGGWAGRRRVRPPDPHPATDRQVRPGPAGQGGRRMRAHLRDDVSVGQRRRRRQGWVPRRWVAGGPETRARASWRARIAISTLTAASVGASTSAIAPGRADKQRRRCTHATIWAWRHSWCELESTRCLRPSRDADHATKVPGQSESQHGKGFSNRGRPCPRRGKGVGGGCSRRSPPQAEASFSPGLLRTPLTDHHAENGGPVDPDVVARVAEVRAGRGHDEIPSRDIRRIDDLPAPTSWW
jgi:hypothetical protein